MHKHAYIQNVAKIHAQAIVNNINSLYFNTIYNQWTICKIILSKLM